MEANVWWLTAIPLLFGLGWFAAQLDSAQWFRKTRQLPESYFKGLNYLLADQHEQALAAFEEVAKLDPETAELYFALGSLFRRRGETERAIRVHRNLLERADLPESHRQQALFCLAQDYLNAGIFDRAESAFSAMEGSAYAGEAQRELAKLYEKEGNWEAAIACLQRYLHLQTPHGKDLGASRAVQEDLSHYACELAQQQLTAKSFEPAQQSIALAKQAALDAVLASTGHAKMANPRVSILEAQWFFLNAQPEQARKLLEQAVLADSKLCAIAIQTLLSYSTDTASALPTALSWALQHPSADTVKPVLQALTANPSSNNEAAAQQLLQALSDTIKRPPYQLASAHLLLAQPLLSNVENGTVWTQSALHALEALIHRYDKPVCTQCGFKASRHHWRCPGCARWNTLPYSHTV